MKIKNKRFLIIIILLISVISITAFYRYLRVSDRKKYINKVLKEEAYAYLPYAAKKYVKEVYEETGQVILTEKNKEDNLPYLNPSYITYLGLSEEEKSTIEVIPDVYVLDFIETIQDGDYEIPTSYDLRNVNGKNYVSPFKDQGYTGICWIFSSIENAETFLMQESGTSYHGGIPHFSVRQMDYVTSKNYLIKDSAWENCSGSCPYVSWNNPNNGCRNLADGGNFFVSTIAMGNGLTLTDESVLPWNENNTARWPRDIIGYDKSLYEVNSTVQMPTITSEEVPQSTFDSYNYMIKYYMLLYGGPYLGTYSPDSTCGFTNTDGTKALKIDDCRNDSDTIYRGHAMQIIGWDDNYEYAYCDAGTKHYPVSGGHCYVGTLTQGRGAWLVRNSWGSENEYRYVYLTYDSIMLSIGFISSMSSMEDRLWDNNYHVNPWVGNDMANGMSSVSSQVLDFDTHNTNFEKVEQLKVFTSSFYGDYNITITSGDLVYNNLSLSTDEAGLHTIDLSDNNILVKGTFRVQITGVGISEFFNNSISVFTSNIDDEYMLSYANEAYDISKPLSDDNPLYVDLSYNSNTNVYSWNISIDSYLKNLPIFANISYRLRKNGNVVDKFCEYATYYNQEGVAHTDLSGRSDMSYASFNLLEEIGETWTVEILYQGNVVNSFKIKFNSDNYSQKTKSIIRIYANNGTNNYDDYAVTDKTTSHFESLNGNEDFYHHGYYITGWNTKADGTGTSYSFNDGVYVYHDMTLYAMWSDSLLNVELVYHCEEDNNGACEGNINSQVYSYQDNIVLPTSTFNKNGYVFENWHLHFNNQEYSYYEQEVIGRVSDLFPNIIYNNTQISVDGTWTNNYVTVSFDGNGGTGNMPSINVSSGSLRRIRKNTFVNDGHYFIVWNTKSDGSGNSYNDEQLIQFTENTTLYAQWDTSNYKIIYDANGGIGNMLPQDFVPNENIKLSKNSFTRTDHDFIGWNTKKDGSGVSYSDEQEINISEGLTLYANWQLIIPYIINGYVIDEVNNYISRITINTEVNDYAARFTLGHGYSVSVDYKNINGKDVLYTGAKTKIIHNSDVYKEFANVVLGDINGDGYINSADLLKIRQHLLRTNTLSGPYFLSSDINNDNTINSADLLRVRQHLLGTKPIE